MEVDKSKKIIEVQDVVKIFGGLKALDRVSISIKESEIFGIVGPNGAGKTTLFNIISGVLKPTSGKIFFNSKDVSGQPPYKMAQMGLGRTFQVVRPFSFMSVFENVMAAYGARFYNSITKSFTKWEKEKYVKDVTLILVKTELFEYKDRKASTLPLGIQRRLEIARALALNPKVLLLDESFSGLSFSEIDELKKLVFNINKEGVSIVVIEHNMPVVMDLCKTVAVLNYGKKLVQGSPKGVVNNPEVIEAYIGKKRYAQS